jgi:hypothetical protein
MSSRLLHLASSRGEPAAIFEICPAAANSVFTGRASIVEFASTIILEVEPGFESIGESRSGFRA